MPATRRIRTPDEKLHLLKESGLVRETVFSSRHDRLRYLLDNRSVMSTAEKYGINFSTIYEWKKRYDSDGLDGLLDKPPIRINPPPSISKRYEKPILRMSKMNPHWGCKRIAKQLVKEGKLVSHTTVQKVLSDNRRATRKDRGVIERPKVEEVEIYQKAPTRHDPPAEDLLREDIARVKRKWKAGEVLVQSVHKIILPTPIKVAFLQEIVDVHGSFGAARVTANNTLVFAEEILRDVIAVFKREFGVNVLSVVSEKSFPNSKSDDPYWKTILEHKKIKHIQASGGWVTYLKIAETFHEEVMTGVINRLPKGKHKNLASVQKVIGTWLRRYSRKPNGLNGGKSPWEMMTGRPK